MNKTFNFKPAAPYYSVELLLNDGQTITLHPLRRDIPELLRSGVGYSEPRSVVVAVMQRGRNLVFAPMAKDYAKLRRHESGFDKVKRVWLPELKAHQTYYVVNNN